MTQSRRSDLLTAARPKVAAAVHSFEKAYEWALQNETPSTHEQLSVAAQELIKTVAHVLLAIEPS